MQKHLLWTCSNGSKSLQTAAAGQKSIPDVEQTILKKKENRNVIAQTSKRLLQSASLSLPPGEFLKFLDYKIQSIAALPHCTRGEPVALVANQKWEMSSDVTATNEVAGTSLTTWLTQQLTSLCIFNSLWNSTNRSLTRFFFFSPHATVSTRSTRLIPCFSFMGFSPGPRPSVTPDHGHYSCHT